MVIDDEAQARVVEARFPTGGRRPWRWDLETGTRAPMPFAERLDTLTLHLEPTIECGSADVGGNRPFVTQDDSSAIENDNSLDFDGGW